MTDIKALADITSEQTAAADSDVMFIEKLGVAAKITWANLLASIDVAPQITTYSGDLDSVTTTNGSAVSVLELDTGASNGFPGAEIYDWVMHFNWDASNAFQVGMKHGNNDQPALWTRYKGAGTWTYWAPASAAEIMVVREEQAAGVAGGGLTSGSWQDRTPNTVEINAIDGASLSSGVITLPAGRYEVQGWAAGYKVDGHKIRLLNDTDTIVLRNGGAAYASSTSDGHSFAPVTGRFFLTGDTDIKLQHLCGTTNATDGRGVAVGTAAEIYSALFIRRIA